MVDQAPFHLRGFLSFFIPFSICFHTAVGEPLAHRQMDGSWKQIESENWPAPGERIQLTPKGPGITFSVVYRDVQMNTNFGFDDPTFGAARRDTVLAVLQYIDSVILDSGNLDLEFDPSVNDPMGSTLAGASAFFRTFPPGFDPGTAFEHITTGIDPDLFVPDLTVQVNFGFNWNSEQDDPAFNEFDLLSVILHEITHGLGFTSLVNASGNSAASGGNPGVFSTYDDFLITGNGKNLFGGAGSFLGVPSDLTGGDGGVFFAGANATFAFGSPPPVHAPPTFQNGSSIGHWDQSLPFDGVMSPGIAAGFKKRVYSPVDLQTLEDLGYQIVEPPAPTATPTPTNAPTPTITPTPSPTPIGARPSTVENWRFLD